MPQKVPWPDSWLVAFRGRSAEGDVLLDFARLCASYESARRMLGQEELWNWWAKHPALLNALIHLHDAPTWEPPFWQRTFSPCETHFKSGLPLEGAVIVSKTQRQCQSPEQWQSGAFKYCTCVRLQHSEEAMSTLQRAINQEKPVLFHQWDHHKRFLFGPNLWKVKQDELAADPEHFRLMFLEAVDKERLQFERLKNKFSGLAGAKVERSREPIPESVRIFVWRRDGGKCVRCGSDQRLEFDHIIPVIEGGSSTERNLQLLCETCNRRKGATI